MKSSLCLAALLAVVGCEPPRPSDAYYPDASANVGSAALDAGRSADATVTVPTLLGGNSGGNLVGGGSPTGGSPTGGSSAGGGPGVTPGGGAAGGNAGGTAVDAGSGGSPGVDSSVPADPEYQRLKQLAGYYLMRMDMLSDATVSSGLGNISTSNRVSHLIVTQVDVNPSGPRLEGVERLCYQKFQSACRKGCNSLTTTMSSAVVDQLVAIDASQRSYDIATGGTQLNSSMQTMYLGFDASKDPSLPSRDSDSRVWDTLPGGAREGLLLNLNLSGFPSVNCDVYTVQKFVSEFSGTLRGTADQPSFENASFTLDTNGGDGRTVGASKSLCADSGSGGGSTTQGAQTVRFKRVTLEQVPDFWMCPDASLWDALPPPSL